MEYLPQIIFAIALVIGIGYFANNVFISFEESAGYFSKKKTILSGYPVRETFFSPLNKKTT